MIVSHTFNISPTGISGHLRNPDGSLMKDTNDYKIRLININRPELKLADLKINYYGDFASPIGVPLGQYELYVVMGTKYLDVISSNTFVTLTAAAPVAANVNIFAPQKMPDGNFAMDVRQRILFKNQDETQVYPTTGNVTWDFSL
ncbi:MAG: hypothetical protein ACD_48C00686G0001, partial [uncultured bacterium]